MVAGDAVADGNDEGMFEEVEVRDGRMRMHAHVRVLHACMHAWNVCVHITEVEHCASCFAHVPHFKWSAPRHGTRAQYRYSSIQGTPGMCDMHGASMQGGDESMFMAEDGDVGEEVAPPGAGLGASSASVGAAGGGDAGAEAAAAVKSKFRRAAPRAAAGAQKGLAVRSAFKSPSSLLLGEWPSMPFLLVHPCWVAHVHAAMLALMPASLSS